MTVLFAYTLRVSAILCIAFFATVVLRRHSAALRHLVLASAILTAAILPILTGTLPSLMWNPDSAAPFLPSPVQSMVHSSLRAADPTEHTALSLPEVEPHSETGSPETSPRLIAATPRPIQESLSSPPPLWNRADLIKAIYAAGTTLTFGLLLLSLVRLGRISRKARPVSDREWLSIAGNIAHGYGLRRRVKLLESDSPFVVATWGLLRPKIVIPAGSAQWTQDRIHIVLGHELAHIARRDWPVQMAAEIFRSIFWFNPLAWVAGRRLRQESEHACDDAVLSRGVPAAEYASHLLDLARALGTPPRSLAPALLMARRSALERRFRALLDPRLERSRVSRASRLLTPALFLCIALPLAALKTAPPAITEAVRTTAFSTAETVRTAMLTVLEPQTPSAVAAMPNSIEGMVVRLGSGEPISDVDIELRRVEGTPAAPLGELVYPPGNFSPGAVVRPTYPNPSDMASARTKSDGKFLFTNLKPGTYRLQAARAGGAYYPAEYGQRDPRGKGYDFQFVEGQSMRDVRLQMAPTGSITGRVVDADGQPAARVRVMALEATYSARGRALGIIQAVQTDDRGDYRLYWLPPGQYVVAARQEDPRRQTLQLFITPPGSVDGYETYPQAPLTYRLEDGRVVEETFETVFYGGDPDIRKARSIDLRPGANLPGIDLSLAGSRVRTRHVRGTVSDPRGARIPGVVVTALPRNSGPSMVAPSAVTDANGVFDIAGVGTGTYTIRAALPAFAGFAVLGTGDSDVDGLALAMTMGGLRVQGKILVEGLSPGAALPDLSGVTVRIENAISGLPGASSTPINGDTFTLTAAQAGDYRVFVNPLLVPYTSDVNRRPAVPPHLRNAYVKAIRWNADDGLAGPVNLASQPGLLEIVIALNGGTLEGVVNDRQQPAPNATVVLIPAARNRMDLFKAVSSDANGRFRMQGLTPGEYKIFAWEYVEHGAWYDPAFLSTHESGGRAVGIREGNNAELPLTMERR